MPRVRSSRGEAATCRGRMEGRAQWDTRGPKKEGHAAACRDVTGLEDVLLRDIRQPRRATAAGVRVCGAPGAARLTETESGTVGAGRGGGPGAVFTGDGVSALRDEGVLGTGGGDSGTSMSVYAVPLICALKVVKTVNFVICVLPRF